MLSKVKDLTENKLILGATVFTIGVIATLAKLLIAGAIISSMLSIGCTLPAYDVSVAFEQEQTHNGNSVTVELLDKQSVDAIYIDHPNGETQLVENTGEEVTVNSLKDGDRIEVIGVQENERMFRQDEIESQTLIDAYGVK